MELIALLSSGKGSWGQVAGLMKKGEWSNIILLGPNYAKEFTLKEIPFEFIEYDPQKPLINLKKYMETRLKQKIKGTEVAVSIASGDGKEHMALLSALLSIPVGIRLVALTKDGIAIL